MNIQISDHQDKSFALRDALLAGGHTIVDRDADVLLIDFDGDLAHYPRVIEAAYESGATILLYSHGAMPITAWDGVVEPSPKVGAYLAQTPGQKWVMEAYEYPHPVHVIGWHFSEQRRFCAVDRPKRLLFAPWHPHGNGWMLDEGKQKNTALFGNLLELTRRFDVTVRYIHSIEANGLWPDAAVGWQPSNRTITESIQAIERADVVIGYGTFAYLAVALGKPTLMYGQDVCPMDGYSPETLKFVKHWERYRDYMRYPYDADNWAPMGLNFVIEKACREEAGEWRERFIGDPFNPSAFCRLVEDLRLTDDTL